MINLRAPEKPNLPLDAKIPSGLYFTTKATYGGLEKIQKARQSASKVAKDDPELSQALSDHLDRIEAEFRIIEEVLHEYGRETTLPWWERIFRKRMF